MRVSHVSVNPSCRISKWTKSWSLSVTEWDIGEVRQKAQGMMVYKRESVMRDFRSTAWYLDEKIKPRA